MNLKKTFLILPLLFAICIPASLFAAYPYPRANENLREELQGDSNRIIPASKYFVFAVDGDAWRRGLGTQDFYHGLGYWIQGRSEIQPSSFFKLNLRSIFYSGSSSEGYANPTGFYNLIGLSGFLPPVGSFRVSARIVDLGRQNIGAGLLVQDRETNGMLVKVENDWLSLRILNDSTGALILGDDVMNPEFQLFQGWIGGGVGYWFSGQKQSNLRKNRRPYVYGFSARPLGEHFSYALEYGQRGRPGAGLGSISAVKKTGDFTFRSKLEYRRYAKGFGKDFVGVIEQQYISYDQYDKPYTNAMNIFVTGDDVQVYAAHLDLQLKLNHHWRLESLNELGRFDFRGARDNNYYFYRAGISYCPLATRDDCLGFFGSNKVLMESYFRPPRSVATSNVPLFKRYAYLAMDAQFRF